MKINFRQRDASLPPEDDWSQTGDWLAELGDDNHAELPGDDHAEPDGTNDPWPAALAEADARDPWPAALAEADARARAAARVEAPEEEEEEEVATTPSAVMTTRLEPGPDQLAVTPGPVPVDRPTVLPHRPRPLEVAQCSLCGIALPLAFMVPDGGQACTDIRWYCKDAMACTHRWTTANAPGQTHMPTPLDDAVAGTREAAPGRASAEQTDSMVEAAQSAI